MDAVRSDRFPSNYIIEKSFLKKNVLHNFYGSDDENKRAKFDETKLRTSPLNKIRETYRFSKFV